MTRGPVTGALDGYTGQCSVGGPPATRALPGLHITKIAVGSMDNNAFLLRCTSTGIVLLVDAPGPAEAIIDALEGLTPVAVLLTHGHHDHQAGVPALRSRYGVPVWCHAADADLLPHGPDATVAHGDVISCGDARLNVIHVRGHTPGGLAIRYDARSDLSSTAHVFVGDSLFPGGPGATGGDAQRFNQLLGDLQSRLFEPLPDATWIYPGHGRDTTLGAERPHLAEWRARGW